VYNHTAHLTICPNSTY